MIEKPEMLIIGAAGRNSGKTVLAERLIARYAETERVIAVKVTAIKEKKGVCPRGEAGCGVCTDIEGDFMITQETSKSSAKDTSRLLAAGAEKVFWIRSLTDKLGAAFESLMELCEEPSSFVIESNSLRHFVRSGLFIMVKDVKSDYYKPSAIKVAKMADVTIGFDGKEFDIDIDRINFSGGKWELEKEAK
jgi:hypothetical protein